MKLLKFLETLCLGLFKNVFCMLHIFSFPHTVAHLIVLRPCWMAGLMGLVVVNQPFFLLFNCIYPTFLFVTIQQASSPFKTFSL